MKSFECKLCGSKELIKEEDHLVCEYCQSRFLLEVDDSPKKGTVIDVQSDTQALLKKCSVDPANRRRYAHLILDIDPFNTEAKKYLT
jgi:DNA-directed RNA polymerase subunit RPC12/RpoP